MQIKERWSVSIHLKKAVKCVKQSVALTYPHQLGLVLTHEMWTVLMEINETTSFSNAAWWDVWSRRDKRTEPVITSMDWGDLNMSPVVVV